MGIVLRDGFLQILVENDGLGFDNSNQYVKHSTGLGLENIQSRIRLIYGEEAKLDIDSVDYEKTEVAILLPKHFFLK